MYSHSTASPACSTIGCVRPVHSKGLCDLHYRAQLRTQSPQCSVEGCTNPIKGHGFCDMHLRRWRSNGDPLVRRPGGKQPRPKDLVCLVPGCGKPVRSLDYCENHYYRVRRYGDPTAPTPTLDKSKLTGRPRRSLEQRFWERVQKPDDPDACWLWTGPLSADGYGRIAKGGANSSHRVSGIGAHRVSYELRHGPVPEGQVVRHKCHNPTCVNPAHLTTGSTAENIRDRVLANRSARQRGQTNGQAKLTDDDVREIRRLYDSGEADQPTIASRYGLSGAQVSRIIRRQRWAHVT